MSANATRPAEAPATPVARLGTWLDVLDQPLVALAVVGAALIATAGSVGLLDPTETRYAEIAREMRVSGDWIVPRLAGLPHFHKPPFAYWATALGLGAFGANSWGARLPVALASIATLAFTWLLASRPFAQRMLSRPGRFSSLVAGPALPVWALGTMALAFGFSRTLASDPFLAAAVTGFWALAPSWAALGLVGLGFLIKGPVVFVLTVLPVLVAALWSRDRRDLSLLGPAWGWAVFAIVALPWYLVVVSRFPGLLAYFVENQLWARYVTHLHHRTGPPWYFVAVLIAGSMPWLAAAVVGTVGAFGIAMRRAGTTPLPPPEREAQDSEAGTVRLLLCWLFVPVVFFSFSGSKLPAYVLPCLPALAILVAMGWEGGGRRVRLAGALTLMIVAGTLAIVGPRLLGGAVGVGSHAGAPLPRAVIVGLAFWAYAAVWVLRGRPAVAAFIVLLGWLALVTGLVAYEGPLGSPRPLVRLLIENRGAGEPVIEYRSFTPGLPFYLGEPITELDVAREPTFEYARSGEWRVVTADSLAAMARRAPRIWVLGPRGDVDRLANAVGLDWSPVASWSGRVLGILTWQGDDRARIVPRRRPTLTRTVAPFTPTRKDPRGVGMRSYLLVFLAAAAFVSPAHAQTPPVPGQTQATEEARSTGMLTGVDLMTSTVLQEGQSSFSGLAGRVILQPQSLIKDIEILPTIEYWRNSSSISQPYDIRTTRKDATLAVDARYRFHPKGWEPYMGVGFGIHFLSASVDAPTLGLNDASDSVIKGALAALAGASFQLSPRIDSFVELKYHHVTEFRQLKINWGLTWRM